MAAWEWVREDQRLQCFGVPGLLGRGHVRELREQHERAAVQQLVHNLLGELPSVLLSDGVLSVRRQYVAYGE